MNKSILSILLVAGLAACSNEPAETIPAATENQVTSGSADSGLEAAIEAPTRFTVMTGGTEIGFLEILPQDGGYDVEYEFRNNGRGPTLSEVVRLDENGLPVEWTIEGASTFGNPVSESYSFVDNQASWTDSTGSDEAIIGDDVFYVPQSASPYWLAIAARALMATEEGRLPAIPGGEIRLSEQDQTTLAGASGDIQTTVYALSGTSLSPTYFLMSGEAFYGVITPGFSILANGYEGEDQRLRDLAAAYGAARIADIQQRTARDFDGPVRIRNVRVFDTVSETLGEPVSVVIDGNRITSIDDLAVPTGAGEVEIQGAGGTLLPGFFEMHGHLGEQAAVLNIAAGVTSVRDTGNNNEVLGALIDRIEAGEIAGPRVYRSGFIEGRSEFSSNNGILVASEEEAVAAVEAYAESGDFFQIKIYNSMNPDWVPAMIARARELGLRVTGHIPAFSNADEMIAAGYDEITHINQIALGWILDEGEDTRTLLRLTALRRLPSLDLDSERVQRTIDAMVENDVAVDPTFAIHEALLLSRNGELTPGAVDYVDHMPVDSQRQARTAWADIATPEDDANYRGAFEQITEILRRMREAGIFMVPGTDLGGSFAYHRELELYQTIGMTPSEILSWASFGMANYLEVGHELGRIAPGYLADFLLVPGDPTQDLREIKTISMVVADGTIYFPSEIYPDFGIRPFADAPSIAIPEAN